MRALKSTNEQFNEFLRETYDRAIRLRDNPSADDLREVRQEELKEQRLQRKKKRLKHFGM